MSHDLYSMEKEFKVAFAHEGRTFWGGSERNITKSFWNAVISFNERNRNAVVDLTVPNKGVTTVYSLPCFNFKPPFLKKEDWERIITELPDGNIAVCCYGGMGRTGTGLAVMKSLLTGSTDDPVKAIRTCYREGAVESTEQIEYVSEITGIETSVKEDYFGNYLFEQSLWSNY
jgi:hypothetical protein